MERKNTINGLTLLMILFNSVSEFVQKYSFEGNVKNIFIAFQHTPKGLVS